MIPVADLSSAEAVLEHARLVRERAKARNAAAIAAKAPKPVKIAITEAAQAPEPVPVVPMPPVQVVSTLADAPPQTRPPMKLILAYVGAHYEMSDVILKSSRRHQHLTIPRRAFYVLARELTWNSTVTIGNFMRRDHTTVIHGLREAEALLRDDPEFRSVVDDLKQRITSAWEAVRTRGSVQ